MALTKPRAYQIYDIDYKQAVRVVSISNVTLSGGAPNAVDGVSLNLNDRILVTGQTSGVQNGIYYVTTVGTGANGTWARSIDTDNTGELLGGTIVMVTEGAIYADTQWKLTTNDPITIGVTSLTFVQNYLANSISNGNTAFAIGSSNANATISVAGTSNVAVYATTGEYITGLISATGNITGGNILTGGLISATGAINSDANVIAGTNTKAAPALFYTNSANTQYGALLMQKAGVERWLIGSDNSTGNGNVVIRFNATSNYLTVTETGAVIVAGNITGGNLLTSGIVSGASHIGSVVSVSGNVTGGNILSVGAVSATGTITTAAGNSSTGFAVGNGAVSNVGLGFFPTAGTRGDYAIRDYSTVFSSMYFDVGIGGSPGGEFRFRASNSFAAIMTANTAGITTPGRVYGLELNSTQSSGDEGGQLNLSKAATNTTLAGDVVVDVFQNKVRFFENGGTTRGAYIDLTSCNASVGTNLLASGGGGGTPGGANTYVQFNDGGTFGGNGAFVFDKTTSTLTSSIVAANNNGAGTNFKVGDDAWIGDINVADTMSVRGQQSALNGYIIFGNSDSNGKIGRAGTGPITCGTAFSATGNITGGNILTGGIISATGNVSGGNVAAATAIFSLGTVGATGNTSGGNLTTSGQVSATGNITGGGFVGTVYTNSIINTGANGTGNIGSSTLYFNTVFAKATSAQYADLAEMYQGDQSYMPGTVVEFGGTHEVTMTTTESSTRIAGVVSTNPSYLMNSGLTNLNSVPVALTGRVPCQVLGPVSKGDRLVSSVLPGVAQALDESTYRPGCMIGKSLEDWPEAEVKLIEVVVGRL